MRSEERDEVERRLLDVLLEEELSRSGAAVQAPARRVAGWPAGCSAGWPPGDGAPAREPVRPRTARLLAVAAAVVAIAVVLSVAAARGDAAFVQDPEPAGIEVLAPADEADFRARLSQAVELRLVATRIVGAGRDGAQEQGSSDVLETVRLPEQLRVRGEALGAWRAAFADSAVADSRSNSVAGAHHLELWLDERRCVRCFASLGLGEAELWVGEENPMVPGERLATLLEQARVELQRRHRLAEGRIESFDELASLPQPVRRLCLSAEQVADPAWREHADGLERLTVAGDLDARGYEVLRGLPQLQALELQGATLDADACSAITKLVGLRALVLRDCGRIATDDARQFGALRRLHTMHWIGTRCEGGDLSVLAALPSLREFGWCVPGEELRSEQLEVLLRTKLHALLLVGVPAATDVSSIGRLPSLQRLVLVGPLEDADLEPLAALSTLRRLVLRNTQTTHAGVEDLRAALPACDIDWSLDRRWFDVRYAFEYEATEPR